MVFNRIRSKFASTCLTAALIGTSSFLSTYQASANDQPLNLIPNAQSARPVPVDAISRQLKTDKTTVSSISTAPIRKKPNIAGAKPRAVKAIKGSLKSGLKALTGNQIEKALSIRAGLPSGSLDRKLLAWSIAMSGHKHITSGEITKIANDLPNWPGQKTMRNNAESALARENLSASQLVSIFGKSKPASLEGAIELASAHMTLGNRKTARSIISPFWRNKRLNSTLEKKVLSKVGSALSKNDHRQRMHMLFYDSRVTAANKLAAKSEQFSLAKARAAVIRKSGNASSLISKVAPASKADPAFLFTQIAHARRKKNFKTAAKLLAKVPRDKSKLIDAHEWWVEQRVVSRGLIDQGHVKTAYKIAANHAGTSKTDRAEGEFHAGWYALRFIGDAKTARKHFAKILKISSTPISQARAYYWLGRASKGEQAKKYYKSAAVHRGTYYGQLAAQKIGKKKLRVHKPKPTQAERARFAKYELVKAIDRLQQVGYTKRTKNFYYAMAERINSSGEMALLSAKAEREGKPSLALRIGKQAYYRGMDVDTLAWPIGAIPSSAKIGVTGKALAYAIARQESEFNKGAVSGANARGLLQLLPGTAKDMARAKGLKYSYKRLTSDAGYNATLGAAYLSKQLDNFDNSYILTIAGYNAGPRRSREWVKKYGDPRGKSIDFVVDWVERIPFTETRNYVMRVMENYTVYKARLGAGRLALEKDLRFGRRS